MVNQDWVLSQSEKKTLNSHLKKVTQALDKSDTGALTLLDGAKFSEAAQDVVSEFNQVLSSAQQALAGTASGPVSGPLACAALESVSTDIMIADPEFHIVYLNPSILKMFRRRE